jgi:hypothetical protein
MKRHCWFWMVGVIILALTSSDLLSQGSGQKRKPLGEDKRAQQLTLSFPKSPAIFVWYNSAATGSHMKHFGFYDRSVPIPCYLISLDSTKLRRAYYFNPDKVTDERIEVVDGILLPDRKLVRKDNGWVTSTPSDDTQCDKARLDKVNAFLTAEMDSLIFFAHPVGSLTYESKAGLTIERFYAGGRKLKDGFQLDYHILYKGRVAIVGIVRDEKQKKQENTCTLQISFIFNSSDRFQSFKIYEDGNVVRPFAVSDAALNSIKKTVKERVDRANDKELSLLFDAAARKVNCERLAEIYLKAVQPR